jgi:hypothetical protein
VPVVVVRRPTVSGDVPVVSEPAAAAGWVAAL